MSLLRTHDHTLADGDVVLRPLTEDDWDALAAWELDPEVLFLAEIDEIADRSLEDLQSLVRATAETGRCWIIEQDGEAVGDARLSPVVAGRVLEARPEESMWRLELSLTPEHWGRQIGRRAARLAVGYAFDELAADSVWAHLGDHNPRAIRMLYHLGFADAGMRHQPPGRKAFRAYDLALERQRWERSR